MDKTSPSKTRPRKGDRSVKLLLGVLNMFLFFLIYLQYKVFPQQTQEASKPLPKVDTSNAIGVPRKVTVDEKKRHLFVTVLLPSVVNEKGASKRLKAIQDTWGPEARAVFVVPHDFDTKEFQLPETPSKKYPQILRLPDYLQANDVSRLKYIIEQVHEEINPDFAFFANDHSFVIPEHICQYLQGKEPTGDMYEGHAMQTQEHVFNSGAAGYFLNRSTMMRLVTNWAPDTDNEYCNLILDGSTQKNKFLQKSPGLFLASCLKEGLNIVAKDTRVQQKYHRFHAFPLTRLVAGKIDGWYRDKHKKETADILGTDPSYAVLLDGEDCCAPTSASFHYVEDLEIHALFAVRQALLKEPNMKDEDLQTTMTKLWPKTNKEIGGYNQGLPPLDKQDEWNSLLATVRKISDTNLQQSC